MKMPTTEAEISLSNLSRTFVEGTRQRCVLDRINVDFARAESVAIRGRSGSGKSTLLNLIAGIDRPDEGSIHVEGIDITQLPEHQLTLFRRQHIGFVYQAFNLLPTLSVADNIRLVLELNNISARQARARIKELLTAVDLADRGDSFPDALSGGEQQRVAIARALSHRPQVLLADEPTGNLDDRSEDMVLALLDSLLRNTGATLLIATHSARVASSCKRVLQLHQGQFTTAAAS